MDKTGEFAFSASADHTVRIWSIEDGSCTKVCLYYIIRSPVLNCEDSIVNYLEIE